MPADLANRLQEPYEQQILITRIFEARCERVFRAWTDPDEVAAWSGREHFDTPREKICIDPRVGGRFELTMVQRDGGAEFPVGNEIIELVEPELIVPALRPMPKVGMHRPTITRVELHELGGRMRMFLTDGPYAESGHAEAGWRAAFDKLAALVTDERVGSTVITQSETLVLRRSRKRSRCTSVRGRATARTQDEQAHVIVVGAGPAGLASALALKDLGIRPLVLDRADQVALVVARRATTGCG